MRLIKNLKDILYWQKAGDTIAEGNKGCASRGYSNY
jgi:hypothetical protein